MVRPKNLISGSQEGCQRTQSMAGGMVRPKDLISGNQGNAAKELNQWRSERQEAGEATHQSRFCIRPLLPDC